MSKALKPARIIDFQVDEEVQIIKIKFPISDSFRLSNFAPGKEEVTSVSREESDPNSVLCHWNWGININTYWREWLNKKNNFNFEEKNTIWSVSITHRWENNCCMSLYKIFLILTGKIFFLLRDIKIFQVCQFLSCQWKNWHHFYGFQWYQS